MLTKSRAAFLMTCEKLFDCAKRKRQQTYFWSFTFKRTYHDWDYPLLWHGFIRELRNLHWGMCGVRVIEPHVEHGLHYHAIIDTRVSVHVVRAIGRKYGIGRVLVERCDMGAAIYLSKYLTKHGPPMFSRTGRRLAKWHTIGAFEGVRKNAVWIDSPYMRARRRIVQEKVEFGYEELLRRAFEIGNESMLAKCYGFLRAGRTASACRCVDRRLFINQEGRLRVRKSSAIPYRIVRKVRGVVRTPKVRGRPSKYVPGPF